MSPQAIPIRAQAEEHYSIGNINALLAEIAVHLERLARNGESGMIDLSSLPIAPGEYEQLRQALGRGEVSARLDAIGASEIIETRYAGVWWVTHYNVEGQIVADMIQIAWFPEILKSQPDDVHAGLANLTARLNE